MTRRRIIYVTDSRQDAQFLKDKIEELMTVETFCIEQVGRDYHIVSDLNQPVYAIALAFCRGYAIGIDGNQKEIQ